MPYEQRIELINAKWPVDIYPQRHKDCQEYTFYANDVELDYCGCIDLINTLYDEMVDYLNVSLPCTMLIKPDQFLEQTIWHKLHASGKSQHYPILESDCYDHTYYGEDGQPLSDAQCDAVRYEQLAMYFKYS